MEPEPAMYFYLLPNLKQSQSLHKEYDGFNFSKVDISKEISELWTIKLFTVLAKAFENILYDQIIIKQIFAQDIAHLLHW